MLNANKCSLEGGGYNGDKAQAESEEQALGPHKSAPKAIPRIARPATHSLANGQPIYFHARTHLPMLDEEVEAILQDPRSIPDSDDEDDLVLWKVPYNQLSLQGAHSLADSCVLGKELACSLGGEVRLKKDGSNNVSPWLSMRESGLVL